MGKIGIYQPPDKYKNYSLPTSKPFKSETFFYKEKEWTLQEQINKKLKKVAEFLESLYPKLTDDTSKNIKDIIENNLETLSEDLELMKSSLHKNPYTFNTKKLKTNQQCITEMKHVCDTLQTVRTYEHEIKKLAKIKHLLHELEHLIQPAGIESSLEKAQVKRKPKKDPILVKALKKLEEKAVVNSKKQKAVSKKAKPTTKKLKPINIESKQLQKSEAPVHKLKTSAKKVIKPKTKLPAKQKKALIL